MLKNVLFRALLGVAALSVVATATAPSEASAQSRRPGGDKAKAAKDAAKAKAKADAKADAKEAAKEKAKEKVEKAGEKAAAKVEKKKVAAAAAAAEADAAEAEATAAEKKTAEEMHAKKLGKIERLEQIATATNNEALKGQVSKLKELEEKRYKLAMAKFEAPAAEEGAKAE